MVSKSNTSFLTKKLAQSARQRLKGVIIDHDVLCASVSNRGGSGAVETEIKKGKKNEEKEKWSPIRIKNFLMEDVRSILDKLGQESKGNATFAKERLQQHMDQLPLAVQKKILEGGSENEDADDETKRIEMEIANGQKKERSKVTMLDSKATAMEENGIRAKYADKLKKVKEKSLKRKETQAKVSSVSAQQWMWNKGATNMLQCIEVRGLALGILPPISNDRTDEYQQLLKSVSAEKSVDGTIPQESVKDLPNPSPILSLCSKMEVEPKDVMIIGYSDNVLTAAREARALSCRYKPQPIFTGTSSSDYTIKDLDDFIDLVHDLNGISYRKL